MNNIVMIFKRFSYRQCWNAIKKQKKYSAILSTVIAVILIIAGIQTYLFYNEFRPRLDATNDRFFALISEKTRGVRRQEIQEQFTSLIVALKGTGEAGEKVGSLYEVMAEHFRQTPLEVLPEVSAELLVVRENLNAAFAEEVPEGVSVEVLDDISRLVESLEQLHEIYIVPYAELRSDLQSPPWYFMPTAQILRSASGYLSSVAFNQALYLAQIGELGTSRVLLTGLHATATDEELIALIYYGLGRLQWELFLEKADPENYFQTVKFLRESMRLNPESSLAKRLFDYISSLTQAESMPSQGKGDPTTLTEGEAGTFSERTPVF